MWPGHQYTKHPTIWPETRRTSHIREFFRHEVGFFQQIGMFLGVTGRLFQLRTHRFTFETTSIWTSEPFKGRPFAWLWLCGVSELWRFSRVGQSVWLKSGGGERIFWRNEPVDGHIWISSPETPQPGFVIFAEDSILVRCTKRFLQSQCRGVHQIWYILVCLKMNKRVRFISFIKDTKEQWHVASILILIPFQSVRVRSCHQQMCFQLFSCVFQFPQFKKWGIPESDTGHVDHRQVLKVPCSCQIVPGHLNP